MTILERNTTATSGPDARWRTGSVSWPAAPSLAFSSAWDRPPDRLTLQVEEALARQDWFPDLRSAVERLAALPAGWNGGNEQPISHATLQTAIAILNAIGSIAPRPSLVPISDGSLQLEWHGAHRSVEVEVDVAGAAGAVAYASHADDEDDDEWTVTTPHGLFADGLISLTRHLSKITA